MAARLCAERHHTISIRHRACNARSHRVGGILRQVHSHLCAVCFWHEMWDNTCTCEVVRACFSQGYDAVRRSDPRPSKYLVSPLRSPSLVWNIIDAHRPLLSRDVGFTPRPRHGVTPANYPQFGQHRPHLAPQSVKFGQPRFNLFESGNTWPTSFGIGQSVGGDRFKLIRTRVGFGSTWANTGATRPTFGQLLPTVGPKVQAWPNFAEVGPEFGRNPPSFGRNRSSFLSKLGEIRRALNNIGPTWVRCRRSSAPLGPKSVDIAPDVVKFAPTHRRGVWGRCGAHPRKTLSGRNPGSPQTALRTARCSGQRGPCPAASASTSLTWRSTAAAATSASS